MSDGEVRLVTAPHPWTPAADRALQQVTIAPDETLDEMLRREAGSLIAAEVIVQVNGETVPRANWPHCLLDPDDIVTARAVVGGGGDSDPVRTVLMVAVAVASMYVGNMAWGATWKSAMAAGLTPIVGPLCLYTVAPRAEEGDDQ